MHPDRPLTAHVLMQPDRILRRAMHGAHDPPRLVRPDGDHAQVERTEAAADLGESGAGRAGLFGGERGALCDGAEAGVAAEVDFAARRRLDGPGGPERVVPLRRECGQSGGAHKIRVMMIAHIERRTTGELIRTAFMGFVSRGKKKDYRPPRSGLTC